MARNFEFHHSDLNNKFYGDDTKHAGETRTHPKYWEQDSSIFGASSRARLAQDANDRITLALIEEEKMQAKARKFKRTTARETFADNHYDPAFIPNGKRVVR